MHAIISRLDLSPCCGQGGVLKAIGTRDPVNNEKRQALYCYLSEKSVICQAIVRVSFLTSNIANIFQLEKISKRIF